MPSFIHPITPSDLRAVTNPISTKRGGLTKSYNGCYCSVSKKLAIQGLFKDHPDTKSYFSHMDVTPGSLDLKTHGGKIMDATYDALKNYGNLHENLAKLRELHTTKLKLNVDTIKLLCTSLVPVIVKHCSTADSSACEKFLNEVAKNLIEA
ncbi:hemoglobin heart muscle subunit alpha-type-like isoform X2 [Hyla sarda]|uniref:hemoglobin heart muscle subunit alpha-type-like isoform X2 n=1 Tax=Hyla sarda TaxID=327740 RepID=UPI0024C3E51E|nr:hemoglobin heart muscle subunit alpha-type-like isoform X2 [Hyla sarda]